jgi:molybdate transport system substrate-binding protein
VSVTPASLEQNVRAVLSKVALGEADAGIVYRTDLASESNAQAVDIPTDQNVVAEYAIGSVASSDDRPGDAAASAQFIDFVLGPAGRSTLEAAGFGLP